MIPKTTHRVTSRSRTPGPTLAAFLAAVLLLSPAAAEPPRPANASDKPGRLVGWGTFYGNHDMTPTLPTGADAEGFVEVAAGSTVWIARHVNGSVTVGRGKSDERITFPHPVIQVAAAQNYWAVLLQDGTVSWLEQQSQIDTSSPPVSLKASWIGAGSSYLAALQAEGKLTILGNSRLYTREKRAALEPLLQDVKQAFAGDRLLGLLHRDGTFSHIDMEKAQVRLSRGTIPEHDQIVVGRKHVLALDSNHQIFAPPFSGSQPSQSAPAGESFLRLFASITTFLGQRTDGTWSAWGEVDPGKWSVLPEGILDLDRLARLHAFALYKFGPTEPHLVIGIAPSLASGIDPAFTALPEARTLLENLAADLETAGEPIQAFDNRYLAELAKLEQRATASRDSKLLAALAEEKARFRDRSRPPASHLTLARLQEVYRKRMPSLEEQQVEQRQQALQKAVTAFQNLQDQLTQANRLPDAVEARRVREELEHISRFGASKADELATKSIFPLIAPADRIFSLQDPPLPGKLVGYGEWNRLPFEVPRPAQRDLYIDVVAGNGVWLARQANGDFYCDHVKEPRLKMEGVPSGLRGLTALFLADGSRGYFAADRTGRLVHWGAPSAWMEAFPRDALRWQKVTAFAATLGAFEQVLAVHDEGSVSATGERYRPDAQGWKNPAAGSTDNLAVAATEPAFSAVLKKDGSVLLWDNRGPHTLPPGISNVAKILAMGGRLFALRKDGTLTGYVASAQGLWNNKARDLTDVVDIAEGASCLFVLRADGRWYYWQPHKADSEIKELTEFRGVRKLGVGGNLDRFFAIGIKPER